jgi:small subunit ribosomal protein S21
MIVFVRDNNVEQALRVLKRKLMREGVLRELKRRRFYEKPSEQAARARGMAARRLRKAMRRRLIADGQHHAIGPELTAVGKTQRDPLPLRPQAGDPAADFR